MDDFSFGFEEYAGDMGEEAIYQIGGDGILYEVGRRKRRGAQRREQRRNPAPPPSFKPAPQAVAVAPAGSPMRHTLDANSARRQPLGFDPVVIAAGPNTSGIAQVNVQREFQAERLILSAVDPLTGNDVSGLVQLTQFLVQSDNQLPSGAPQSLIGYRYDAIGAGLMATPAQVGAIIRLGFTNLGATQVVVSGVFYGMTRM